MSQDPDSKPGKRLADPQAEPEASILSADLLRGRREILIQHDGETYRLRLTKNGKLILHK